jgi:hypothetical protein
MVIVYFYRKGLKALNKKAQPTGLGIQDAYSLKL